MANRTSGAEGQFPGLHCWWAEQPLESSKEGWYMGSRPCSKPGVHPDTEDSPEQRAEEKEPARACDSRGVQVALVMSKPWWRCRWTCLWGPNASCPLPTWLCCRPVCPANPTLSEPSDSVFYPVILREARRNFLKRESPMPGCRPSAHTVDRPNGGSFYGPRYILLANPAA